MIYELLIGVIEKLNRNFEIKKEKQNEKADNSRNHEFGSFIRNGSFKSRGRA
jgi:hypothetical protein